MGRLFFSKRIFFILLPVFAAISFGLSLGRVALEPSLADSFYNADSLFFSIIYQELFLKQGANLLTGWKGLGWTPAFYFFPDLIQYFGLRTIFLGIGSGVWELTHLCYAFLQWSVLVTGILYLLSKFSKEKETLERSSLILSAGYLAGTFLILSHKTVFVFFPGFHGGIVSILGWAWAAFFIWEKKRTRFHSVLLFFLVCVFSLSDLLFIPYFILPILSLDVWDRLVLRRSWENIRFLFFLYLPILLGVGFSRIIAKILYKNDFVFFPGTALPNHFDWNGIFQNSNVLAFWDSFTFICRENAIYLLVLWIGFLFVYFLRKKGQNEEHEYKFENLFLLLGAFVPVAFLFYGILFGLVRLGGLQTVDRYFGEILLSAIGILFVFFWKISEQKSARVSLGVVLFFVSILSSFFIFQKGIGLTYYPEKIACLDELAKSRSWKRGLASFWYVRPMRIFSRQGLEPDDYLYDLMLFYWQNRLDWFERDLEYSFAIIDGLDESKVREKFGEPSEVVYCKGVKIFAIADRDRKKTKQFVKENRMKIALWKKSVSRD